jgi:succinate dehydrogenase/fumarate reductase flavoprotein subunit
MKNYAADRMQLAPRDLISRLEQIEVDEGCSIGPDGRRINLEMTHLGCDKIEEHLPQVQKAAHREVDETILSGYVADQVKLYVLLAKLSDPGLALIAVWLSEAVG